MVAFPFGADGCRTHGPASFGSPAGHPPLDALRRSPTAAVCEAARRRLVDRRSIHMTLAGLEPAIFGSEDQRLIH